MLQAYNVKNAEECLDWILNGQIDDAILKAPRDERPKLREHLAKC